LGKTTFAKSIAKALNRKFYNISLGGVTDSSILKGHRRTYIGAYSGKIIEALKNCETNNPVILLDEIDKMGSSYQGDPRSELLEILDPNQNNSFVDNFVDVPVDLSNVLFITSANYEQNISKPLLDRMEKIKLSSYTKNEKV
jgi:ATP-dependent Lon protease